MYTKDGKTQQEIADAFGLGQQTIADIISNTGTGNSDKRRKLTKDEDGMIILDYIVLHIQIEMMQHEKHKIFYRTGCP